MDGAILDILVHFTMKLILEEPYDAARGHNQGLPSATPAYIPDAFLNSCSYILN